MGESVTGSGSNANRMKGEMRIQTAYDELIARSREISLLASCSSLLGWDEQTYMPRGGVGHRGEQMALLAGLHHEKATAPRIGELLDIVEDSELVQDPETPEAVNIRELRRNYLRATKLPRSLVEELARTTSRAQQEWIAARRESEFGRFRPWLESIITLKRREAECLGFEDVAYDALLDEYEAGAKSRYIAALFDSLRRELVPLVGAIMASRRTPKAAILHREYPIDRQRIFAETMAAGLGFDFERGRLDVAAHPFCSGIGPGDCRITTRYDLHGFSDAFFGVLHEVGHGLYEQGLDPEQHGTPMGEAVSLSVHESQSRLWENAVGRCRPFWQHAFPLAKRIFADALHDVSLDDFHFAVNLVEPSVNRVQADEVTYNLHILARFELERAMISDDLQVAELPAAWNEKYAEYLGIAPPNDAEGCLQDIHWSAGLIGYFPTYTLGNLYGAQFYAQAHADIADLNEQFARGEFTDLLDWLRERIHRQGHRYRPAELVERVTGSPPCHGPLLLALRSKYGALYGVDSAGR
jgi:carboxypeptidase Taq